MTKYRTIVIDPPWDIPSPKEPFFLNGGAIRGLPYKTMTDDEIKQFPINDYADVNCDLFMWVTHSTLPLGLEICKLWGFKYHALLTWDKTNGLTIRGIQRKTEYVIYSFKGNMGLSTKGKSLPSLFKEELTTHSTKPRIFYDLLLKKTKEPRIDIFSRKKHIGFDSFGNQAEEPLTLEMFNK